MFNFDLTMLVLHSCVYVFAMLVLEMDSYCLRPYTVECIENMLVEAILF